MTENKQKQFILRARLSAKFFLGCICFAILGITSCTESGVIGVNVQPKSDLLNVAYKDTTTLIAYSVREDSIPTSNTSFNLLGSYNDPVFGYSSASIYTQVLLPNGLANVNLGPTGQILDSAVLVLPYGLYYYGNLDPQTVQVYQVTQDFYNDSTYYSSRNLATGALIGSQLVFPQPTIGSIVNGVSQEPQLRIRLNTAFFESTFLRSPDSNLVSNAAFVNYFKGIYITPANGHQYQHQGAILTFNLLDPICGIQLYYRNPKTPPYLSANTITFSINGSSARFGHFYHNYRGTSVLAQYSDTTLGTNNVYVQSIAGVKTEIKIPHLQNWTDSGKIVVNKAEFDISVNAAYADNSYLAPTQMYLVAIDSMGKEEILPDQNVSSNYFGGVYNTANSTYTFDIARYVQQVLNGHLKNRGLYLVAGGSAVNANRVVLYGGSKTNPGKMRLRLTYTKLY
ncbi:MAG: DUF4270 domain-containing protein [Bacteroidia bacterium]